MPRRSPHSRRRPRRGATLVELLVALLLLDLALLALAGMSAVAVQRLGEAGRRSRAAIAATSRVEWLSSRGCGATASGGGLLEPGVIESWTSTSLGVAAEVVDSIRVESHSPESIVIRSRVPC